MAVLNVTPDSFFDGGLHNQKEASKRRIYEMLQQGANIIDVGPESTRPGAAAISPAEQIDRAALAVRQAKELGAFISIDTCSPAVAEEALKQGAKVINDVSCLADPALARLAAEHDADLIIMHSRGTMAGMKDFSVYDEQGYDDVVVDVAREWNEARERAEAEGLKPERIWFDPGLGFHKTAAQSRQLMQCLEKFSALSAGIVLGASRKSFIGALDGSAPAARLGGSLVAALRAVEAGAAALRVHDVHDTRQALLAQRAFRSSVQPSESQHA